jgi:lipopolysaccharide export system permease protein
LLTFTNDHRFVERYDGEFGGLSDAAWLFGPGVVTNAALPDRVESYRVPTDITRNDMEESFAAPDTVSFWAMPSYIAMLKATGFPVGALQIQFISLLVLPFLCAALIMVAASVALRPVRAGGQMKMAVTGILLGFGIFFMTNFLQALGASGQIPALLAATAPAGLTFAAGVMVLLTLEDR